jgi:hypothetical protein
MGAFCVSGSLVPEKVRGKIVLCDFVDASVQDFVVRDAGGAGIILANTAADREPVAHAHIIPGAGMGQKAGYVFDVIPSHDFNVTFSFIS